MKQTFRWLLYSVFTLTCVYVEAQTQILYTDADFANRVLDQTLAVGKTPIVTDVTATGAAVASIPIALPAGTNGMQPALSIAYNSMGGNGLCGYGWNLSGLSAITRSGRVQYYDFRITPVSMTNDDIFEVDGNKLKPYSGENGADGAVYGGELENYSRTTSYGNINGSPEYFIVETKDGKIVEYVKTTDARKLSSDGKVIFWKINKVTDIFGNYTEYIYEAIAPYNDHRIKEINYTGNAAANISPYNKIKFEYQDAFQSRTDANYLFLTNTAALSAISILQKITITTEQSLLYKTYSLLYATDGLYNYLKDVVETGSDGIAKYNKTSFKYGTPNTTPLTLTRKDVVTLFGNNAVELLSGDYNGDGVSDMLVCDYTYSGTTRKHTRFRIFLKTPSTDIFTQTADITLPANQDFEIYSGGLTRNLVSSDFNGDGRDDILIANVNRGQGGDRDYLRDMRIYYPNSTATQCTSSIFFEIAPGTGNPINRFISQQRNFLRTGDFNGDGRTEFMISLDPYPGPTTTTYIVYPALNEIFSLTALPCVNSSSAPAPNCNWLYFGNVDNIYIGDFDGDGKHDVMTIEGINAKFWHIDKNTFGKCIAENYYTQSNSFNNRSLWIASDFNGDRKTDILTYTSWIGGGDSPWTVHVSKGAGFAASPTQISFDYPSLSIYPPTTGDILDGLILADFNGDGLTDIGSFVNKRTGTISSNEDLYSEIYYSTGYNFSKKAYNIGNAPFPISSTTIGDWNGDGRTDILRRNGNSLDFLRINTNGKERLLDKIADGMNNITTFAYKYFTDGSGFYQPTTTPVTYPLVDIVLPVCGVFACY